MTNYAPQDAGVTTPPRIGSLCSGYGGLDEAAAQLTGGRVAWVSDIDKGACKILAHRYPDVPNLGDFTKTDWAGVEPIYMLTAGYPCQPFSHAGKRAGTDDARHLWPEVLRCLTSLRPPFALFENVRGHLSLGFDQVLADLATHDYDARWIVLRAADIGAPHGRARLFILAADARRGGDRWDLVGSGRGAVRLGGVRGEDSDAWTHEGRDGVFGGVTLLKTPTAQLAINGGSQHPDKRKAGGHGPTLADEVEHLLPTPAAADGSGAGRYNSEGHQDTLPGTVRELVLMPTPRASDGEKGGPNQRGSSGDLMLPSAVCQLPTSNQCAHGMHRNAFHCAGCADESALGLLPTPTARDWKNAGDPNKTAARMADRGQPLTEVAVNVLALLPTPRSTRGGSGTETMYIAGGQRTDVDRPQGTVVLHSEAQWGEYADAIHRWEQSIGRPAPEPTQTSTRGNPQLSARFVEWMMGLPEGWVDDVPNMTRNEKLKALGNGVVTQQAVEGVRQLLALGGAA